MPWRITFLENKKNWRIKKEFACPHLNLMTQNTDTDPSYSSWFASSFFAFFRFVFSGHFTLASFISPKTDGNLEMRLSSYVLQNRKELMQGIHIIFSKINREMQSGEILLYTYINCGIDNHDKMIKYYHGMLMPLHSVIIWVETIF